LVVVMRRLDEKKQKPSTFGDIRHCGSPRNWARLILAPRSLLLVTLTVTSL
jgi:hypothetical protein